MKYFTIQEFTAEPLIPPFVASFIVKYHIQVMDPIREEMGGPILVSKRSGYRSPETEFKNKRSGDSEHTFKRKGAADYTADNIELLGQLLLKTPYTRICYYPDNKFYHCDYKNDKRQLYIFKEGWDGWRRVEKWL